MEAYGISECPNGNVWLCVFVLVEMYGMCVCPSRNVWYVCLS